MRSYTLNFQRYIFFLLQGALVYWILATGILFNKDVNGFWNRCSHLGAAPCMLEIIVLLYLLVMHSFRSSIK